MTRRRRQDDDEDEDHSGDRVVDWKTVAPRWLLLLMVFGSFGLNGLLGSMLASSVSARLEAIQDANDDPKWDMLAQLSQTQAEQAARIRNMEALIRESVELRREVGDLRTEVKVLNARVVRTSFR